MEGFVYFHRKIAEWEWYTDANTFRLFFHLVLNSNHKDNKWRGILINRGQCLTSYSKLAKQLNLSEKQIRNAIKKLEKTKELVRQSGSQYSIITVVNYDTYQTKDIKEGRQPGRQRADEGQAEGRRGATNNNDNNDNNDNKKKKSKKERAVILAEKIAGFKETYSRELLKKFYEYWTESGDNDKKMRFEKERSFSIKRRLTTWKNNENNFKGVQKKTSNKNFSDQWSHINKTEKYEHEKEPDFEPLSKEDIAKIDNMPF